MLNLLFLVSCLPVVTMGSAWSGLYGAVRYMIRGDSWFEGYREGFKNHFFRNNIGMTFGIAVALYSLNNVWVGVNSLIADPTLVSAGTIIPLVIAGLFMLVAMLVMAAMIPVSLYFYNDISGWLSNTWDMILHYPHLVLCMAVLMWAPPVVMLCMPNYGYLALVVFVAMYFTMAGVLNTALAKKPLLRILAREREENPDLYPVPTEEEPEE